MLITRITKGVYRMTRNGRHFNVTDTGYTGDHGAWRWNVAEDGDEVGYNTSTYKEAKEIVIQQSLKGR